MKGPGSRDVRILSLKIIENNRGRTTVSRSRLANRNPRDQLRIVFREPKKPQGQIRSISGAVVVGPVLNFV